MFANPIWSLAILAGLVGLYIVVRIRHGKPLYLAFAHLSGVDWLITWVVRFRSYIVNIVGGIALAGPDIFVALTGIDLTPLIGEAWAGRVSTGVLVYHALNTVFRAKPDGTVA